MKSVEQRITKGLSGQKFTNEKSKQRKEDQIARGIDRFPEYRPMTVNGKEWKAYNVRGC